METVSTIPKEEPKHMPPSESVNNPETVTTTSTPPMNEGDLETNNQLHNADNNPASYVSQVDNPCAENNGAEPVVTETSEGP